MCQAGTSRQVDAMWYFAYGSNLCESRLSERTGAARYGEIARLSRHEFRIPKVGGDGLGKTDAFCDR